MSNKPSNIKLRKEKFETTSGIEMKQTYVAPENELEQPGSFPFTRGVHQQMYRSRLWTMRQYAGFSTAEASNERYHYLLNQGVMGLSVAFDLPTQIGYNSDHEMADGEVGKVGVAIDSVRDMETLFKGIPLADISTSMTINSTGFILLALYIAVAKQQGANVKKLRGTIQNDILKEYAARGTYIYPPKPSMRIITDVFEYCSQEVPLWNTISVSGYHIREAGSTAVQELAFTLANGKAYLQAAINKGLDINVFAKRISFFFNAHNNLFEEVAKFRAARRMWANITKAMGATDAKAQMLRFHTQTGGSTLTAQQPLNNVSRVTIQALSAVLGGTQSLHTNGYDEALALPTEAAAKIALRTQQVLAHESGVTDTVDPLAGSYFVEALTNEIEQKANDLIEITDKMGGMVSAIEQGYVQQEIANSAYAYQQAIEDGSLQIIGVNQHVDTESEQMNTLQIDDSIRQLQIEKIEQLKTGRDATRVETILNTIQQHAKDNVNLMPIVIEAVENKVTLGEISDALRNVFGEHAG